MRRNEKLFTQHQRWVLSDVFPGLVGGRREQRTIPHKPFFFPHKPASCSCNKQKMALGHQKCLKKKYVGISILLFVQTHSDFSNTHINSSFVNLIGLPCMELAFADFSTNVPRCSPRTPYAPRPGTFRSLQSCLIHVTPSLAVA